MKGLRGLTLGIKDPWSVKRYRTVARITLPSASRVLALFAGSALHRSRRIPFPATRRSLVEDVALLPKPSESNRYRCRRSAMYSLVVLVEVRDEVIARLWRQVRANDNLVGLLWRNNLGQWNLKRKRLEIFSLVNDVTLTEGV